MTLNPLRKTPWRGTRLRYSAPDAFPVAAVLATLCFSLPRTSTLPLPNKERELRRGSGVEVSGGQCGGGGDKLTISYRDAHKVIGTFAIFAKSKHQF